MDALLPIFLLIMGLNMIFYGYVLKRAANAGHGITGTSGPMRTLHSDEHFPKEIPMGSGWHDSYGWQRRKDLDEAYDGFMYETPDGHLVRSVDLRHKEGMYLDKYVVEDTGEAIFQISAIPRVYSRKRNKLREL
tara:strand:- start:462 stop:863 length:402 start_codon:yes stop_codon:yes gene_type:complete